MIEVLEVMVKVVKSLFVWQSLIIMVPCLVVIFGTLYLEWKADQRKRDERVSAWRERPYDYETDGL